jgi:hypothetical protein
VAARLILYLAPFYGLFYSGETTALTITFISLALLWRHDQRARRPAALIGCPSP